MCLLAGDGNVADCVGAKIRTPICTCKSQAGPEALRETVGPSVRTKKRLNALEERRKIFVMRTGSVPCGV